MQVFVWRQFFLKKDLGYFPSAVLSASANWIPILRKLAFWQVYATKRMSKVLCESYCVVSSSDEDFLSLWQVSWVATYFTLMTKLSLRSACLNVSLKGPRHSKSISKYYLHIYKHNLFILCLLVEKKLLSPRK